MIQVFKISFKISNISVAKSENSVDHYASTIYKATVKYSSKFNNNALIKLIVKIVNSLKGDNSFDIELNMYLNTVPDMQRLLSQNGEKVELAPRYYQMINNEYHVISYHENFHSV